MKNLSLKALLVCYAVMVYVGFFFYPKWNQTATEATISWDASGYYMYLPAIFIYNDLKHCGFKDAVISKYKPTPDFQQAFVHEKSGNYVMKYSSGQAIMMSPFFFVAHTWARNSAVYPADGFSYPYNVCIGIGMFLYGLLGLFVLRKILLHYFKDTTVAILLLGCVIGSNYINYAAIDQAMTHSALFTLYTLLIYLTIQFYKQPTVLKAAGIGAIIGLAALTRPTEIIAALIPVLWGINSYKELPERFSFFKEHWAKLAVAALFLGAIGMIQPLYWKWASGEWIVYSYQDQGFSWLKPHINDYVRSYKCGWLRYCPMMILAFVGTIPFWQRNENRWAILSFFALNFYIVTAWDVWDYGSTAGRAMVQSYPILAFPLAALIEKVNDRKWFALGFYPVFFLFTYLNIWWVYHAHAGNVQVIDLTKQYYWSVVGRWSTDDFDKKLLDNIHSYRGYPKNFEVIYENNFDTDSTKNLTLSKDKQFTPEIFIERKPTFKKWIRVSADINCVNKEWDMWRQFQFIVRFYNGTENLQTNMLKPHRFISDGETKNLFLDAIPPDDNWNKIGIHCWNADSDKTSYIDNLKVITFEEE